METKGSTSPAPRPRRWRWVVMVFAVMLVTATGWLASHAVPRRGYFPERRGTLTAALAEPEVREAENYVSQAVRVTADNGLVVDFRVLRPTGVARPLPLVVLLGGHETGRDAVSVVGDPGTMVVAALDYPYHGPRKPRGVAQSLGSVPAIQRGLLDTPPAVSLVLDWLLRQPWVDAGKVELMGISLGVPFAAVAGALDARVRRVWLVHGGVDNRAWIANRLEGRIGSAPLRHTTAALLHLLAHGASFKTEEWAPRIAPRAVVVVGAAQDEQMPRENVERLFAAARAPKELLWSEGGHVRPDRVDIVRQLLAMVRQRLAAPAAGRPD